MAQENLRCPGDPRHGAPRGSRALCAPQRRHSPSLPRCKAEHWHGRGLSAVVGPVRAAKSGPWGGGEQQKTEGGGSMKGDPSHFPCLPHAGGFSLGSICSLPTVHHQAGAPWSSMCPIAPPVLLGEAGVMQSHPCRRPGEQPCSEPVSHRAHPASPAPVCPLPSPSSCPSHALAVLPLLLVSPAPPCCLLPPLPMILFGSEGPRVLGLASRRLRALGPSPKGTHGGRVPRAGAGSDG